MIIDCQFYCGHTIFGYHKLKAACNSWLPDFTLSFTATYSFSWDQNFTHISSILDLFLNVNWCQCPRTGNFVKVDVVEHGTKSIHEFNFISTSTLSWLIHFSSLISIVTVLFTLITFDIFFAVSSCQFVCYHAI